MLNEEAVISQQLIQELMKYDSAIVSDCLQCNDFAMDAGIKPLDLKQKVCGRAITVSCSPCDNLMLHLAVAQARPGDVLVASMNGHYEGGAWGEILTVAAKERGIAGLIIDGSVRDTTRITELQFPVFSRSVSIKKTDKKTYGKINESVVVGGVSVSPMDIVLGDADGVVVVPSARVEEIVAAAKQKVDFEDQIMNRLKHGELTVDLFELRKFDRALNSEG